MGNCSPRKPGGRIRIRKLFLDIDIPQSSEIRQSISANSITDSLARKVGQIYTFCIEDSTDEDYNDFYINIAAWDKKG